MRMTRACEYGLQGVLYLAMQPEGKTTFLSEISKARSIPCSFLGKIFLNLAKAGIVKSIRGIHGGFILARRARDITMRDIIEAVEGDIVFSNCLDKSNGCVRVLHCSMVMPWRKAQKEALDVLGNVNFEELARKEKKLLAKDK